jgi:hypothetical protein
MRKLNAAAKKLNNELVKAGFEFALCDWDNEVTSLYLSGESYCNVKGAAWDYYSDYTHPEVEALLTKHGFMLEPYNPGVATLHPE